MAPNKFDINRTPGQKPGLKEGDVASDLSIIKTNVPKDQVKDAMLTFDSFVRNGKYFGVEAVGRHVETTDMLLGDEEDKPDVPGDKNKDSRVKYAANITVSKGMFVLVVVSAGLIDLFFFFLCAEMCNKFGFIRGVF